MKTTKINITCGIYETEIILRDYGHKICVTEPFVRWSNNTGTLDFEKWTTTNPKKMQRIRAFAANDSLCMDDGTCWSDLR